MTKLLLVDDQADIRELEKMLLSAYVDEIIEAGNGIEAIEKIDDEVVLVIMDYMMPEMDGVAAVKEIRTFSEVPILFLSAKGQEYDKIVGYAAGADDYLVKPFSPQELQLKVQAMLRRHLNYNSTPNESQASKCLIIRELTLNTATRQVTVKGKVVSLTGKEFDILYLLAKSPGRIFSAEMIYETVWQEPYFHTSSSTIMTHIKKLRQKLEADPKKPHYILTVWGVGYKIEQ
jgi:two-component system OmpR family response regulator